MRQPKHQNLKSLQQKKIMVAFWKLMALIPAILSCAHCTLKHSADTSCAEHHPRNHPFFQNLKNGSTEMNS
jgi:hypothetical protein